MKRRTTILFVLLFGIFQNCGDSGTAPSDNHIKLSEFEKEVASGSNSFGFELFRQSFENTDKTNLVLSPFSVSMALGMTLNGAGGRTYADMRSTLGFNNLNSEEINQSYRNLIDILQSIDTSIDFQIANSIWCRDGFPVLDTFKIINQSYFDALIRNLDFSRSDAADTINDWVSENTNGKIPEIIEPPISRATIMFLINAIYFNASWTYEFDPDLTEDALFYQAPGEEINCRLMNYECEHLYYRDDNCQVVDIPYGDGNFRMRVILPDHNVDMDSFISELNDSVWDHWTEKLAQTELNLYLPKFKLAYKQVLNDVLVHMGMAVAFSEFEADFSYINPDYQLFISKVNHKTFIDVSEEGTEAAAVTSVAIAFTSIGGDDDPIPTMRVDHPFIFAIHEVDTGAILFIGKIAHPEYTY